ncbi:MAG TPA: nitrilase-related carbon-nitrogen hydrolase, partial [Pseudonocardia sp.]|nr:nitrilase-related carbon-nitrogen hydrolase [Pseudonocardia sp.]
MGPRGRHRGPRARPGARPERLPRTGGRARGRHGGRLNPVTVAACQIPARIGSGDHGELERAVREAVGRGARLVVLPELAVCGYVFRDAAEARAAAQGMDGPTVTLLRQLSRELGCVLVCGLAELGEDGAVH